MWGQPDLRDGSNIPDYDKFLDWANEKAKQLPR